MVRVTFYYTGLSQCFCAVFKYAAIYVLKFQALFPSDFSCLDLAFCYCLLSSHCVVLLRAHVCKNAFPFQISMLGPLFYSISYCSQINLPQFPMNTCWPFVILLFQPLRCIMASVFFCLDPDIEQVVGFVGSPCQLVLLEMFIVFDCAVQLSIQRVLQEKKLQQC